MLFSIGGSLISYLRFYRERPNLKFNISRYHYLITFPPGSNPAFEMKIIIEGITHNKSSIGTTITSMELIKINNVEDIESTSKFRLLDLGPFNSDELKHEILFY